MESRIDGDVFIKSSTTPLQRRRLEKEAEVLRRAVHPGVVELVGDCELTDDAHAELRTRFVGRGSLADLHSAIDDELLGVGAACATILADVHALGICHGRIEGEHVLLDPRGRPVLCGWGDAPDCDEAAMSEDVGALASLVLARLSPRAPAQATRILRRAAGMAGTRRALSARELARALSAPGIGARLPDRALDGLADQTVPLAAGGSGPPDNSPPTQKLPAGRSRSSRTPRPAHPGVPPRRSPPRPRRGGRFAVLAALLLLGLVVGLASFSGSHRSHRATRPAPIHPGHCPRVDEGCGPVSHPGGVLLAGAARYALGDAPAVVVLGRWTCGPLSYPALLQPGSGRVWVFTSWARPGHPTSARLVANAPGAQTLTVLPGPHSCDSIVAVRPGSGGTVVYSPRGRA